MLTENKLISLLTLQKLSSYLLESKDSFSRQMLDKKFKESHRKKFKSLFRSLDFDKVDSHFNFGLADIISNELLKVLASPRKLQFK